MRKSVIALIVTLCIFLPTIVGCKKPNNQDTNSSSILVSKEETIDSSLVESEKNAESSKISTISSSVSEDNVTEDKVSSATQSHSVKLNRDGLKIGMYHMSMNWCDSYGSRFEDREREFRENVEAGYFNTYFLSAKDLGKGYLLREIQIIAENGGTFWLAMGNYHSDDLSDESEDLKYHESQLQLVIDAVTKMGYRDNLMGMIWDEPIWNGQTNRNFLTQSELYYKKFGLRTFPVFATGEFSGIEGNLNAPAENMGKIATEALKYVTDVGFDSYGVDVRLEDGYVNGAQASRYEQWAQALGTEVKNGQDYYVGYKELLKKRVGHDVNIWYFPTAFNWPISNGGNADEAFCAAHLEFMAEDLLKEKYQGGIALYTYYAHSEDRIAFAQRYDIKNKRGQYTRYTDYEKWDSYCELLRKTKVRFDSIKAKIVDLGL